MIKKYFVFIIAILSMSTLFAQSDLRWAPRNPDFIQYLKKLKTKTIESNDTTYVSNDYVPMPVDFNFDHYFKSKRLKGTSELASKFDLRKLNKLTPVKNQGQIGTCWSFATLGSIESHWLMMGLPVADLSEQNLATCHGFQAKPDNGGNDYYAAAYFSRYAGPYLEKEDPYSLNVNATCKNMLKKPVVRIPTARWLPKDMDLIKKYLTSYGAISSAMYVEPRGMSAYYNNKDFTYCYSGSQPANHAVLIVGWDDNKVVTGGSIKPANLENGAWIVRNSWGASFGERGFFYVSYQDTRFLKSMAIYPEREEVNASSDSIYCYDQLGGFDAVGFSKQEAYALSKFTTKDNKIEHLTKVGTFIQNAGSKVTFEVYKNKNGDVLSDLITTSEEQTCDFPGYYTFDILAKVQGDFYIKCKYYSPGVKYPIPVETALKGFAQPQIQSNVSWISKDNQNWNAVGAGITNYEMNLSIRAYTRKIQTALAFFTINKTEVCAGSKLILKPNTYPNTYNLKWEFGGEVSSVSATASENQTISFLKNGEKLIKLIVDNNLGQIDTMTRKISVVNLLNIQAISATTVVNVGRQIELLGVGEADLWQWSPATNLSQTGDRNTVFSSKSEGEFQFTLSALQGVCIGEGKVTISVKRPPANDNACNAIELKLDQVYNFSNQRAGIEEREPKADTTSTAGIDACNTQHTWCNEGGLHNTIWFKYKAPANGMLSIDTKGMDTKIALYETETCSDLFETGKFIQLAANDDYHDEKDAFGAAISLVKNLKADQYYYIQVDGSGGGSEGYFSIQLLGNPLGINENINSLNAKIKIYPNPSQGQFTAEVKLQELENLIFEVYDTKGSLLYQNEIKPVDLDFRQSIDLNKIEQGIYILKIRSKTGVYTEKISIQ